MVMTSNAEMWQRRDASAEVLREHRNVTCQVWNECSDDVLAHVRAIRETDADRLVTNSPGFAGELADAQQNAVRDYLGPYTSRQAPGCRPREVAPREIASLLQAHGKPVVDNEPARNGLAQHGGPFETTYPFDHILQIHEVWKIGGHIVYHHDMFQRPGSEAVPPHGIPDPEFSAYHRTVFEFIGRQQRYRDRPPA